MTLKDSAPRAASSPTGKNLFKRFWPLPLGLTLWAALYLPHINDPFLLDDRGTIVLNSEIDHPIAGKEFFNSHYYSFSGEESWRPLATFSYYAMARIFGKSPAAMRTPQWASHVLIGFMLCFLALSLGFTELAASWAAAFFWLQPANIETLMCVSFNEEVLVALGLLFFLLCHRHRKYFLASLSLVGAFLSKETAIAFLPLVFLHDFLTDQQWKEKIKIYALYFLIAAAYLTIYFGPLKGPGVLQKPVILSFGTRLFFALTGFETAIRIFLLPLWLRIEYFALPPASWIKGALELGIGIGLLCAWGYGGFYFWKKNQKRIVFFLLWPMGFLALTSNLFPMSALNTRLLAERWLYLPFLGLSVLAGAGIYRRSWIGILVLIFWSLCGWTRLKDWESGPRLWSSLAQIYPWCAKADEGLGESYFQEGHYLLSQEYFRYALWLRKNHQDRVLNYYSSRDPNKILTWKSSSLYRWLGSADIALGKFRRADHRFSQAIELNPADGYSYDIMTYEWAAKGDWKKSREWLDKGLKAVPRESFLLRIKPDVRRERLSFKAKFD